MFKKLIRRVGVSVYREAAVFFLAFVLMTAFCLLLRSPSLLAVNKTIRRPPQAPFRLDPPGKVRHLVGCRKLVSILIVVIFNQPFYDNIPILKRLYSHAAGKLVFYGPEVRYGDHPVRKMDDAYHGYLQQVTLAQAWRENPGHDGLLWFADDLFLNLQLIFKHPAFSWRRVWLWQQSPPFLPNCESGSVNMTMDHLQLNVWSRSNPYVGDTDRDAAAFQESWRRDLPARYKQRQLVLFGQEVIFKHGADFGYIPQHLMAEFLIAVDIPSLAAVTFETFIPTFQRLLTSNASDVTGWHGLYFWRGKCPAWHTIFDCKQHAFMHPVKLSSTTNKALVQNLPCSPLKLNPRDLDLAMCSHKIS
eukprot:scpid63765/ scgid35205/ 